MKKLLLCLMASVSVCLTNAQNATTKRIPSYNEVMGIDTTWQISTATIRENKKDEWLFACKGGGVNDYFYLRSKPNVVTKTTVQIWVRELTKDKKIAGKTYPDVECVSLVSFDCDLNKAVIISESFKDLKGNIIKRTVYEEDESKWEDIEPDTVMEILKNKVCEWYIKK